LQELETELDAELALASNDEVRRRPLPPCRKPPAAEEFDHEIANIYSEEAAELLEAAEVSLSGWNLDR